MTRSKIINQIINCETENDLAEIREDLNKAVRAETVRGSFKDMGMFIMRSRLNKKVLEGGKYNLSGCGEAAFNCVGYVIVFCIAVGVAQYFIK